MEANNEAAAMRWHIPASITMHDLLLRAVVLVLACTGLAACATPAFKNAGNAVPVAPSDVQYSPDRFTGSEVVWGGRIIALNNHDQTTEVEVIGYPLDRDQQPMPDAATVGRFIIVLPGLVESTDYPVDRHLSVYGIVSGTRLVNVDEREYLYPLLSAREVNVWPWGFMFDKKPAISIGIGVSTH